MQNARLNESQAGIKIAERNINNLRYTDDTTLLAESKEELKILLMRMKEESENLAWNSTWKNYNPGIHYHLFMANRRGRRSSDRFSFLGFQITVDSNYSHKMKTFVPWKESYDQTREHNKKQRHHFANEVSYSQSSSFSSSHVQMWELDHKEGWALKNWCFRIVVLGKTLESPLDHKEIIPVNPKGNQPWIFIGRNDAEAQILWLSDKKSWLTGKDHDAGKDWGQEEKRETGDEIDIASVLKRHGFEQTPGGSGGQGSLVCHSPGVAKSQTQLGD